MRVVIRIGGYQSARPSRPFGAEANAPFRNADGSPPPLPHLSLSLSLSQTGSNFPKSQTGYYTC